MTKARDLANASTALSAVSATELAFVDGVTSAIQTQMDAKAPSSTAVTLTGTQTLTNKTLTSPVIASVINNTLTSTTGDIIYASAANTPARLGIGSSAQVLTVASGIPSWATPASGSTFVGCSLTKSAAQSIATATETAITFNTEVFDTDSFHSTSSNTSRITIPSGKAGKYLVNGQIMIDSAGSGGAQGVLYLNGATRYVSYISNATPLAAPSVIWNNVLNLSVGDYIELFAAQYSGTSKDVLANSYSPAVTYFTVTYLGA